MRIIGSRKKRLKKPGNIGWDFWKRYFFSVAVSAPIHLAGSNRKLFGRSENCRLARRRSKRHLAHDEERVSRLRRRDAKDFRAQARPQPSAQPRLSNLPCKCELRTGGRTLGREGRLRVGPWPKIHNICRCRRRLRFRSIAECRRDRRRASRRCSQRHGPHIFEPAPPIGTNTTTDIEYSSNTPIDLTRNMRPCYTPLVNVDFA